METDNRRHDDNQPKGAYQEESPVDHDARMKWWRDAKFGMFIHWGVYAVPAGVFKGRRHKGNLGEWIMHGLRISIAEYEELAKQFNPVRFDADQWVRIAHEAGMKYMVITAKHHDGFAMYHSKVSQWNIVDATPFGRDPLRELADACARQGMKLGFYYSQAQDWYHAGGIAEERQWDPRQKGDWNEYVRTIAAPQVREILTNYGPVAVLWWDSARHALTLEGVEMLRDTIKLQPDIIVNGRLGKGYKGDFGSSEQVIPATGKDEDWEACMTMNNTWGYRSDDHEWKSSEDLLVKLIDVFSKGGNFLINVGPKADGTFPRESIDRLRYIGEWMKVNGEAIYGTTASPFPYLPWGRCTKKVRADGSTLYFHVLEWPEDSKLIIPGLKSRVRGARLLATGAELATERQGDHVIVELPSEAPHPVCSVVVIEVEGAIDVDPLWPTHGEDGSITLPLERAMIHNRAQRFPQARCVGKGSQAQIESWRDFGAKIEWQCSVTQLGTYDLVAVLASKADSNRIRVLLDDKEQSECAVPNTGSMGAYQTISLGQIKIDQAGLHVVALQPIEEGWDEVILRILRLELMST